MTKLKLPDITQEPIMHVDGTPDEQYPLRILRAYRENCNCKWASGSGEEENTDPLLSLMNQQCDERAKILDRAICVLEKAILGRPILIDLSKRSIVH